MNKTHILSILFAAALPLLSGCGEKPRLANLSKPESVLPLKAANYPLQALSENVWICGAYNDLSDQERWNIKPLLPDFVAQAEARAKEQGRDILGFSPISDGNYVTGFVVTLKAK